MCERCDPYTCGCKISENTIIAKIGLDDCSIEPLEMNCRIRQKNDFDLLMDMAGKYGLAPYVGHGANSTHTRVFVSKCEIHFKPNGEYLKTVIDRGEE